MKNFFNKVASKATKLKQSVSNLCSKFNKFVKSVKMEDIWGTAKQTLKDLRRPKEAAAFISAVIMPGGLPAYFGFKFVKHINSRSVANDNIKDPALPLVKPVAKKVIKQVSQAGNSNPPKI